MATHRELSPAKRGVIGFTEGLLRISVGIDDVNDILADIEQALKTSLRWRRRISAIDVREPYEYEIARIGHPFSSARPASRPVFGDRPESYGGCTVKRRRSQRQSDSRFEGCRIYGPTDQP